MRHVRGWVWLVIGPALLAACVVDDTEPDTLSLSEASLALEAVEPCLGVPSAPSASGAHPGFRQLVHEASFTDAVGVRCGSCHPHLDHLPPPRGGLICAPARSLDTPHGQ